MPITLLTKTEPETRVILPRAAGIEERDPATYPLPPGTDLRILDAVVAELRQQGHVVTYEVHRERLVSWDETHRRNQRSFGLEDAWRPDPKGPTVLHFVAGGSDVVVTCGEKRTRLMPHMLRVGRAGLKFCLLGRA